MDSQGRIVATIEDYTQARWLLGETFATTVSEGVTHAVRQTVQAVARLSPSGSPITEQQIVKDLGLAKSTISYRVNRALKGGFLVNQNTKGGAAAQLVLGAPLPDDDSPLPNPEELLVSVETRESDTNPRTPTAETAMEQIGTEGSRGVLTSFEPGSNSVQSYVGKEFELFEGFSGDTTHTERVDEAGQGNQPWDDFLREVDRNAHKSG